MRSLFRKRTTFAPLALLLIVVLLLTSCTFDKGVIDPAAPNTNATQAGDLPADDFESFELDWNDAARKRLVPTRLYWPQVKPGQLVPLIVFSHGMGGSRSGYSYLGSYWAKHGYASLHVQHVGSDRNLWRGNIFSLIPRLQAAAHDNEAVERVRDFTFALDQLLSSRFGGSIDQNRIVAAGHSYGANTVMLVAGARVVRKDQFIQFRDARVRAAIIISAPPFYGETDLIPILGQVEIPTFHITCTDDIIKIPGYESPASDRIKVFEAMGSSMKLLTVFQGGSHSIFTDRSATGGVLLNPQVKAATQALTLAFLHRVFDGVGSATEIWNEEHRALISKFIVVGY